MALARFGVRTTPRRLARYMGRGRIPPAAPEPVERADLSRYNAMRKGGYQPYTPPTLDVSPLVNMQNAYNQQMAARPGANRAYYTGQRSRLNTGGRADLSQYNAARKAGYQPQPDPVTGRVPKQIPPAIMAKLAASEPQDNSGAFEQHNFYQGEEFINYLYNEGIVPHFGAPSNVTNIHAGRWTDYLLTKMGITSYGVNPYASPYIPQQEPAPGGGGYGGRGYGGRGGGGGYEPEPPKQYGSTRNSQGRNVPEWLMGLVNWTI